MRREMGASCAAIGMAELLNFFTNKETVEHERPDA
jgi:hypothetical protein